MPLARQDDPPWSPQLNNQSISGLSASVNSTLLAGHFLGDVHIGESKSKLRSTISCIKTEGD
jgi:hypothetical protein